MLQKHASRERGQVIIVAALVVAVVLVGLALVLNSGIYAENLSSRQTTDTDGALSYSLATNEAVAEAYVRTNDNDSATAAAARATFNESIDSWESARKRRAATRGVGVDVNRTPHVGWRLEQSTDRAFTSNSGTDDWTVADGTGGVATFTLNVTRDDLYDASADWANVNGSFRVHVSGATGWDLYLFQNGSHVVVHQGSPGSHASVTDLPESDTCAVDAARAVVDVQAEELGGSNCGALNFSDDVAGPVDISYHNTTNGGEQVNGTYELVVNGSSAAETSNFSDPDGSAPTATAIVYAASYETAYERSGLAHDRSARYMVREETYGN